MNNISSKEAASIPLVGITCILGFRKCGLHEKKNARVLILGGAGGVAQLSHQTNRMCIDFDYAYRLQ